jgi:hypothetical protein
MTFKRASIDLDGSRGGQDIEAVHLWSETCEKKMVGLDADVEAVFP